MSIDHFPRNSSIFKHLSLIKARSDSLSKMLKYHLLFVVTTCRFKRPSFDKTNRPCNLLDINNYHEIKMKKLFSFMLFINASFICSMNQSEGTKKTPIFRSAQHQKLALKLQSKQEIARKETDTFQQAESLFEQGQFEAAELILIGIAQNRETIANKNIVAKSYSLLFEINQKKLREMVGTASAEAISAFMEANTTPYLAMAARYGHRESGALLALSQEPPSCENDVIDQSLRIELENHSDVENIGLKKMIKERLAYDYKALSTNKKTRAQARAVFQQMMTDDSLWFRVGGALGIVKLATTDQEKIGSVAELKRIYSLYIQNPTPPLENHYKYDLAVALTRFGDRDDALLAHGLLLELQKTYHPAEYFLEENSCLLANKMAPPVEAISTPVAEQVTPVTTPASLNKADKASAFLSSKNATKKTSETKVCQDEAAGLTKSPYFSLSQTATKDLKKIVQKNKGQMPSDLEKIGSIAQTIIENSHCSPKIASKIVGTDNFWRSHIARDYRMDWRYDKNADGSLKIEIRHIGLKKNFSYR